MQRNSRVVLNRKAVEGVRLAIADGVHQVAKAVVQEADPPDDTPYGVGLVRAGGTLAYVDGKKIDDWSQDGTTVKKPRALRLGKPSIVGVGGYGFPARFQELGTVHQPARPFLAPTRDRVVGRIPSIMARAAKYRIARLRK